MILHTQHNMYLLLSQQKTIYLYLSLAVKVLEKDLNERLKLYHYIKVKKSNSYLSYLFCTDPSFCNSVKFKALILLWYVT